jgi:hypothetical protein
MLHIEIEPPNQRRYALIANLIALGFLDVAQK